MKKLYLLSTICTLVLANVNSLFSQQFYSVNSPSQQDLYSVFFTDANNGYAVGDTGTILKTIDAGKTWNIQNSGVPNNLRAVHFPDANTGYVVGSLGAILKTVNGGNTWTSLNTGITFPLQTVFFTDINTGFVSGLGGSIYKTTDGGTTWTTQSSGTPNDFFGMYFFDSNTGWDVGAAGTIRKTTNGGSFWNSPNSNGTSQQLNSVHFLDTYKGFAVGNTGAMIKCIDGGIYWNPVNLNTSNNLNDIFFQDSAIGFVVGNNGTLLKTNDGGSSWGAIVSGSSQNLHSVFFINASNGCIVGKNGTILKTCDLVANAGTDKNICSGASAIIGGSPSAFGGTAPYSFTWSPNSGLSDYLMANPVSNANSFTVYTLSITDGKGCSSSDAMNYYVLPVPSATITSSSNVDCFGSCNGQATVSANGGTSPYSYLWSSGDNTPTAPGLCANSYSVSVTGGNGCKGIDSVIITQPSPISASLTKTDVSCSGGNNGTAAVIASGGVSPYSYYWDPADQSGTTATGLIAGTYTVNITDLSYCSFTSNITIPEPGMLIAEAGNSQNYCSDFPVTIGGSPTASGGVQPYTFLWGPASNLSSITDSNPKASPPTSTLYFLTVTDANGCNSVDSVPVTTYPQALISITSTDVTCFGAANGNATVSGGTSYLWSNGSITNTISGLSPLTYFVTGTNSSGCTGVDSVIIIEPSALSGTISSTNVSCFGNYDGTATINGIGGTSPYSYLWSNGSTGQNLMYLTSGVYSVTLSDDNGCGNLQYSAIVSEPTAIVVSVSKSDVVCNGDKDGGAIVAASGGTAPYYYYWSNGLTTDTISGLDTGNFTVDVYDYNGCLSSSSVIISQPGVLDFSTSSVQVSCNGLNDGAITISPSGGTPPYYFSKDNGNSYQSGSIFSGLIAGTYDILLKDSSVCFTAPVPVFIQEPTAVIAVAGADGGICSGFSTQLGSSPTASGGSSPYTYLWSPAAGLSSPTIANPLASPGNSTLYTLDIVDSMGCTGTDNVTITVFPLPNVNAGSDISICDGSSATLSCSGANGFIWNNGATTQAINIFPSFSTVYSVTGTDVNGCTASDSVWVIVNPVPMADFSYNNACLGTGSNYSDMSTLSSGSIVAWSWNFGDGNFSTVTNPQHIYNSAGAFPVSLSVVSDLGCSDTIIKTANVYSLPPVNAGPDVTICPGNSVQLNASGGIYYSWLPSSGLSNSNISNPVATPLTSTNFVVTAQDANNCSGADTVLVIVNPCSFSVFGTIYNQAHDTTLNYGVVYLFGYDTVLAQFATVDSTDLSGQNGDYVLSNHPAGEYIILFRPDNSYYPDAIPTYYGDTAFWTDAKIISLGSDTSGIDISTREIPQLSGSGVISGLIQYGMGSGKTGNGTIIPMGDPVPGIDVSLEQIPGGIIKHTTTDTGGFYSFNNLPLNTTYKLFVDVPGLPMDSTYVVDITLTDTVVNNLDYVVDTTTGSAGIFIGNPLFAKEVGKTKTSMGIFPNPGNGIFYLEIQEKTFGPVSINIFTVLGEEIYRKKDLGKTNLLQMDLTNLPKGLYLIKTKAENQEWIGKIIIE